MKMVFLRGSVPPLKEHPDKLIYSDIDGCEDMWTQLFYYLLQEMSATGELLYEKGDRIFKVGSMTDKWMPSFKNYKPDFNPDVIMCRGGFPYYDALIKKFPNAKKVYYGAGKRFYPQTSFTDYDLFLVDSERQLNHIKKRGKNVALLIKPAATLFKPVNANKDYDVCFVANASQAKIKRHKLLLESFAGTKHKILAIGSIDNKFTRLAKSLNVKIDWLDWSFRKNLPNKISRCKVGICCSTNYDSCPRVIPEYLACGLSVVATKNINFWHKKYITAQTGVLVDENKILNGVQSLLEKRLDPYRYYLNNLSMDKAAKHLASLIGKIL